MAEKIRQPSHPAFDPALDPALDPAFDPRDDLSTDYVLIAVGVGAALIALVYLLWT